MCIYIYINKYNISGAKHYVHNALARPQYQSALLLRTDLHQNIEI